MRSHGPKLSVSETIRRSEQANRKLGHENLGPLSFEHGFIPAEPPVSEFPASHRLWDEVAAELPDLYAALALRLRLEALPVLDAGPEALPDRWLQRAASVLGILVHAYHRVEPRRGTPTPRSVAEPWEEVCRRLGRGTPFLAYSDLAVCNWRHCDPAAERVVRVGNTRLLVPTVGTDEEQFFHLTQLEMLARGTHVVSAAAASARPPAGRRGTPPG
ncbi:hypothetical protein [Streptomyces sp. KL2]|uniref:hypothetical protein n=1 Tax=Streptomyces sp. KL2 TaxID=3050126 RepID=UPI00397A53BA